MKENLSSKEGNFKTNLSLRFSEKTKIRKALKLPKKIFLNKKKSQRKVMVQKFYIHSMIKQRKMKTLVQVFMDLFLKVKPAVLSLNKKLKQLK